MENAPAFMMTVGRGIKQNMTNSILSTNHQISPAGQHGAGRHPPKTARPKKKRRTSSPLARATFHALKPFIDIEAAAVWVDNPRTGDPGPRYMISEAKWDMLDAWQAGKRPACDTGSPFRPRQVFMNILGPRHVQDMLDGSKKHYATGGTQGLTELTLDIDAHEDWQDDLEETTAVVTSAIGANNIFPVASTRGNNLKMKLAYGDTPITEVNAALDKLDSVLKKLTAHNKCLVEVKGKIGTGKKKGQRGTQAKLVCYGAWSWEHLEKYKALRVVSLAWIKDVTRQIEERAGSQPAKTTKTAKKKIGSTTGIPITEDQLALIPSLIAQVRDHAYYCMARRTEVEKKGVKLTWKDFACAFVVLSICKIEPNDDGQLPMTLIKVIWQKLYHEGHFDRGHDDSRIKAIRNTLADCGFLDVIDNTYWFDQKGEKPGKAMQWCLKDEYTLSFDEGHTHTGHIQEVSITIPVYVPHRWRPKRVAMPGERPEGLVFTPEMEEELDRILCVA